MEIKTNNHPREPLLWEQLTPKEQAEFDWMNDSDHACAEFVRYRGAVYTLSEFCRVNGRGFGESVPEFSPLAKWDGYHSDSYFSGVVVRYVDHGERVILGTFYT